MSRGNLNLVASAPKLLDHLVRVHTVFQTGRWGLIVDFDGTIAEIASRPDEAMVSRRAADSLRRLADTIELVCVMSGRAVRDLQAKVLVDNIMYVGNHGAEYLEAGQVSVAPGVAEYRDKIKRVFDGLRTAVALPGLVWDDKQHSVSVHYRLASDPDHARRMLQVALDSATGTDELEMFWGKMVLEIRAPVGLDKGYAVRKLVREREVDSVVVIGDDTTDVDALNALGELRAAGDVHGIGVAVIYEDSPEELVRSADYGLEGVSEVEVFLESLAAAG